jgi:hypothetical protein
MDDITTGRGSTTTTLCRLIAEEQADRSKRQAIKRKKWRELAEERAALCSPWCCCNYQVIYLWLVLLKHH